VQECYFDPSGLPFYKYGDKLVRIRAADVVAYGEAAGKGAALPASDPLRSMLQRGF
jgi:hypothetical protein